MAAYTTIDDPGLYFRVKTFTGNSTNNTAITWDETDASMQPDLLWLKQRTVADQEHWLVDAVRGAAYFSEVDTTAAEADGSSGFDSFDSNGFTVDNSARTNRGTMVAWGWKESAVSGMDIVTYTGNETARTISHSLSAVPRFMLMKTRDSVNDWFAYHYGNTSAPETEYLKFNTNEATVDGSDPWNDTAPTSSVFTVGIGSGTNKSSGTMVAYLFAEKQGFSKFGYYTGNGNANGPFVFLGFRPAFVIIKRTSSTQNWYIWDNKRLGYNVDNNHLQGQDRDAEGTADTLDLLSNGFKIRESGVGTNGSGDNYIYIAFAEAPFVNSNGVPCNAR